jgi:hypothetical protein
MNNNLKSHKKIRKNNFKLSVLLLVQCFVIFSGCEPTKEVYINDAKAKSYICPDNKALVYIINVRKAYCVINIESKTDNNKHYLLKTVGLFKKNYVYIKTEPGIYNLNITGGKNTCVFPIEFEAKQTYFIRIKSIKAGKYYYYEIERVNNEIGKRILNRSHISASNSYQIILPSEN